MTHRTLTSEAEISAYLHRTRMAILHALRGQPATASQIAAQMNVHPANLTRHIRILAKAGLIELVEKRDTGRNLEKYYAAVAGSFDVAPEAHGAGAHKAALTLLRSDLSAALATLPDEDPGQVSALLASARISSRDIDRFAAELERLVVDFQARDLPDGEPYHLNLSLYPGDASTAPVHHVRLAEEAKRP